MVRDLVEAAIRTVTDERRDEVRELAKRQAVERVIDVLHPETRPPSAQPGQGNPFGAALGSIFGSNFSQPQPRAPPPSAVSPDAQRVREQTRGPRSSAAFTTCA